MSPDVAASRRPRRPRRSSRELRETILREARVAFAENGYQGASTRTIAAAAGASESLIFTNWGSKASLFRSAVLEPFEEFVAAFQAEWNSAPRTTTLEHEARLYIGGLFDVFARNRELVLALVAAEAFEPDVLVDDLHETFQPVIDPIIVLVTEECARRGWGGIDPGTVTRSMFGMVVSMTVLDGLMYRRDDRPSRDLVVDQMARYWVGAIVYSARSDEVSGFRYP